MGKKITVLIIEDSAFMRRELTRIIDSDQQLRVIGATRDGAEGLEMSKTLEPDVVTIDLNLPGMDGITCLQHIMIETPRPCVMISAYTGPYSVETFEALELGAVDFVEKPSGEISRDIGLRANDITRKIKAAALVNLSVMTVQGSLSVVDQSQKPLPHDKHPDKVVVIGVSTGGPRTLNQVIPFLPGNLNAPVVVIQHMPQKFTNQFAQRLDSYSLVEVREAQHGDPLRNGVVYVAPGGSHLFLTRNKGGVSISLDKPSGGDILIPSVEKAMDSAIDIFGGRVIGVILTGMGADGAEAMERLYELGGETIAESEESAILFGMPQEVISRGAARCVVPASEIAERIVAAVKKLTNKD